MKPRTLLLISGIVILFSLVSYYLLGGFGHIEYVVLPAKTYQVMGRPYEGRNNTDSLKRLFYETRKLLEEGEISGVLTIVNDENKYDDQKDLVGYFLGVISSSDSDQSPPGFIMKEFGASGVIRAGIVGHNLVMPKPDKVRKGAEELARERGLSLSSISIEKYLEEGAVEVDFLLK